MLEHSDFNNNAWRMSISDLPELKLIVATKIPDVSADSTFVQHQTGKYPLPADSYDFEPLTVTFKLGKGLSPWKEIFRWKMSISSAETTASHKRDKDIRQSNVILTPLSPQHTDDGISLMFHHVKPVRLTGPELDYRKDATEPSFIDLTMDYAYYTIL